MNAKKNFKQIVKLKKQKYYDDIVNQITNSSNPNQFWEAIKTFRGCNKGTTQNNITKTEWKNYYQQIFDSHDTEQTHTSIQPILEDAYLDEPFTLMELNQATKKLAKNKAPGADGIPNEVWKNCTMRFKQIILKCFNEIFEGKQFHRSWAEIIIQPIYKKGDRDIPKNYRPISLLNTSLKLYTQLLNNRLLNWCESNNKISIMQGGFQRKKGCAEQIFVLNSVIHHTVAVRGKELYAAFIDLSGAFDSINHEKLWRRLEKKKISTKMLSTIKQIYKNATARVKTTEGLTESFPIKKGVLQGETMSPTLFNLFIDDLAETLDKSGTIAIRMGALRVHILLYADDQVLMATSPTELQKKIEIVSRDFKENDLVLNTEKTKIVVFRSGNIHPKVSFTWDNKQLEIVDTYTYLGVPMHCKMKNHVPFQHFKTKAETAIANLNAVIRSAKLNNIEKRRYLFESMVRSIISYPNLGY